MNILYALGMVLVPFTSKISYNTTVLTIDNLDFAQGGMVKVQVYDEQFMEQEEGRPVYEKTVEAREDGLPIRLAPLPEGNYMIAVLHDSNGNGKLDYSFFGVPKEGYAFTGKFTCGMKSAGPSMHYIHLNEGMKQVNVHLCY